MKLKIEQVRISANGKEILTKIKKRTGLTQWNHICRIGLLRSLAMRAPLDDRYVLDTAIEIEWRTFSGLYQAELAALIRYSAHRSGIALNDSDQLNLYFRKHLERGIAGLAEITSLPGLILSIQGES
jgi:DNA sulfur modification protein DndE